jgi:membrane protein YqaA with SNARE-associated domain
VKLFFSFVVVAALALMLGSVWLGSESSRDPAVDIAIVIASGVVGAITGHVIGYWIDYQPRDKHSAKRFNESVKLTANSVNALALAAVGAAVILPLIRNELPSFGSNQMTWIVGAMVAHLLAHAILGLMKSEDL